jgi:predicted transcriptional regulator
MPIDKYFLEIELSDKERYMLFMKLVGLSHRTIANYVNSLSKCSMLIKENLEKAGYTSLYDVNKQDEIRKFQQLLETNKDFIALNHTSNNQYSASVYNYVKFIDFLFVFGRKK